MTESRAARIEVAVNRAELSVVEHVYAFHLELHAESFEYLEVLGKRGVYLRIARQAYVALSGVSKRRLSGDRECTRVDPVVETLAIQRTSGLVWPLWAVDLTGIRVNAQADGNGLTGLYIG